MSGFAPRPKPKMIAWVTTQFVGFHEWPAAPPSRSYLADRHRHVFHIKAGVEVLHDDRDVEFHDLIDIIHNWLPTLGPIVSSGKDRNVVELGGMSCEAIGVALGEHLSKLLPNRELVIEVSEDGEAGATITLA